jgi:Reverse transcriptase (RNA-dependent DNA polymerase)
LKVLEVAASFYENLFESTLTENERDKMNPNLTPQNEQTEESFTIFEIESALNAMKNSKATSEDKISSELLKICDESGLDKIVQIFNEILKTEKVPTQWCESTITLIFKKGDRKDIRNYRPISITSHMYKLFMRVLLNRLDEIIDKKQDVNQAGFRKGFSTTDHLFVVNQVFEKCEEFNKPLYCAFIDYNKAFDSVEHPFLWNALLMDGINPKYVRILKNVYDGSKSRIKLEEYSRWFKIRRGIKQGDPFSPKAFNSAIQKIFNEFQWTNKGLRLYRNYLSELRFADDVLLFAETIDDLIKMMGDVFMESSKAGLTQNIQKTKVMSNQNTSNVVIQSNSYEIVEDYCYLGQIASFDNRQNKQIESRISAAWRSFWSLKKFFKSKMANYHKKRLFDACVLPVFTYGSQTWALTETDKQKIAVAQRNMERSMLNIRLSDQISNEKIRKTTKVKDVVETMSQLKWSWAGHIARYPQNRLPTIIEDWQPETKRRRGHPKARWRDAIANHASCFWRRKAKDRKIWSRLGTSFI